MSHSSSSDLQTALILGFLIVQEAQSHCDKAVSSHFLLLSDLLGRSFALQDLLRYLKAPGTVHKGCWTDQWQIVLRLNFMCKGGITSRGPPMVPTSLYSSPQWTWSVVASPAIGSVLDFSAVQKTKGNLVKKTPWRPIRCATYSHTYHFLRQQCLNAVF